MIEVQKNYNQKLSFDILLYWHKILMEDETAINAGVLRKGKEPMKVISGKFADIKIHYEAPTSNVLLKMMKQFVKWYQNFQENGMGKVGEALLFSAIAHLYFKTLHPFEDGNGRIDSALAK